MRRTEVVGPAVSAELKRTGIIAVIVSLIGIFIYVCTVTTNAAYRAVATRAYDANGNAILEQKPDGEQIAYRFDRANRRWCSKLRRPAVK